VQTAYISLPGNFAGDADINTDSTIKARAFVTGTRLTRRLAPARSWRSGTRSPMATLLRRTPITAGRTIWARRLAKASSPVVAVLNEGISGAKVLSDHMGVNAFDRDVLSQPATEKSTAVNTCPCRRF